MLVSQLWQAGGETWRCSNASVVQPNSLQMSLLNFDLVFKLY